MPEIRSVPELVKAVEQMNLAEQGSANGILEQLRPSVGGGLRNSLAKLHSKLNLTAQADRVVGGKFNVQPKGAKAFVEVLKWHAKLGRARTVPASINFLCREKTEAAPPELRLDCARLITAGALALGHEGEHDERFIHALVDIAFGADAVDTILRRALLGKPDPLWNPNLDQPGRLPGGIVDIERDPATLPCKFGLRHALNNFAQQASLARLEANVTWKEWATGIAALLPSSGYAGTQVKVQGSGFGSSQPRGVGIRFPQAGGRCLSAEVLAWSDTEIVAIAPEGVGDGFVGFVQRNPPDPPAIVADPSAAAELAGFLESCFGPAVGPIADKLMHWMPFVPSPRCPTALPDDANHFHGGPEITLIAPTSAKEGDTVVVNGNLFASTDAVFLGGQLCQTVPASPTQLQFVVPPVSGGEHYLRVHHSPNQRSNPVRFDVIPVLLSASPARQKPRATIALSGTGFAPGALVRVNGETAPTFYGTPHQLDFTAFRPVAAGSNPPSKSGHTVAVEVVLRNGMVSNAIPVTIDNYRIVVFGDSIAWGQGLEYGQKFSTLVRDHIVRNLNLSTSVYNENIHAHSGAIIGLLPPAPPPGSAVGGEVPIGDPTVAQQVGAWSADPERSDIDLVLMDGGINDVNFREIINPTTSSTWIKSACKTQCHDAIAALLTATLAQFPKAKIVLTGYYPILSAQSDTALIGVLLAAIGVRLAGIPGALIGSLVSAWAKQAIVNNCATFAAEANRQLQLAADEANSALGTARVFLAVPAFQEANAALAPDAWVWGIRLGTSGAQPEDPVAASRSADCDAANASGRIPSSEVFICKNASAGHPNIQGAKAYADAIIPFL